jgi:hypothetical protein
MRSSRPPTRHSLLFTRRLFIHRQTHEHPHRVLCDGCEPTPSPPQQAATMAAFRFCQASRPFEANDEASKERPADQNGVLPREQRLSYSQFRRSCNNALHGALPITQRAAQQRRRTAFPTKNDDVAVQRKIPIPRHKRNSILCNPGQYPMIRRLLLDSANAGKKCHCCHIVSPFSLRQPPEVCATFCIVARRRPSNGENRTFLCFQQQFPWSRLWEMPFSPNKTRKNVKKFSYFPIAPTSRNPQNKSSSTRPTFAVSSPTVPSLGIPL